MDEFGYIEEMSDSNYNEFSADENEVTSQDTGILGIVDVDVSALSDAIEKETNDRKSRNNFESQTVDFTETADFSGTRPPRNIRRPRKYDDFSTQFANTQHVRRIRREIVSNVNELRSDSERPRNSAESRSQAEVAQASSEVRKWLNVEYLVDVCVACEQLLVSSCRDNSLKGEIGLFDEP